MMWFWLELSISSDSGVCQTFKKKATRLPRKHTRKQERRAAKHC